MFTGFYELLIHRLYHSGYFSLFESSGLFLDEHLIDVYTYKILWQLLLVSVESPSDLRYLLQFLQSFFLFNLLLLQSSSSEVKLSIQYQISVIISQIHERFHNGNHR